MTPPPSSTAALPSPGGAARGSARARGRRTATARRPRVLAALPRPGAWYVVLVDALAGVALILGLTSTPFRWQDVSVFGTFVVCGCVSVEGSRQLMSAANRRDRAYKDLLSAWTLPVALLLPPLYAVLVYLPIIAFAQLRVSRQPWVKRIFNTAVVALAGYLAALTHNAVTGTGSRPTTTELVGTPRAIGAALLAALVCAAVSALLVAGVLVLVTPGRNLRQAFGTRDAAAIDAADLCVGLLVAVIWTASPVLVVLALLPVLLLQRTLLHGELLAASRTDTKTGLANPAYWRDVAEREVTEAVREHRPLAVLLIDIDHFKAVNDTCGHLVGDAMLAEVAHVLQRNVRPRDLVGRFGGEEFAVLMPGMPAEAATGIAGRLREAVAERNCPLGPAGAPLHVTISIGVATLGPASADVTSLLAASDAALYRAKQAGRNRVVLADTVPALAG